MTIEDIENRQKDLQAQLDKYLSLKDQFEAAIQKNTASIQATHGAIQDCEYWKEKVREREEKKNEKKTNSSKKAKVETVTNG